MLHLILYTRRDCHLCEEMRRAVLDAARTVPLSLQEVDVDHDPDLARRYGREVPVLVAGGQEIVRHRVAAATLRALLEARSAGHQDP